MVVEKVQGPAIRSVAAAAAAVVTSPPAQEAPKIRAARTAVTTTS